ncbi:hypothetical protein BHE74_00003698 [Ensete ventricosum]|nr:hypothetical protein BHE74_00003698 [Ensete ventricosum]
MAHIATIGLAHRPDASTSYADVATDLVAELARTCDPRVVDEGELPRERTKNRRWQRSYDVRTKAKELHKTGINGLLIKIAESEGLRIDAGVLDQGTK